MMANKEMGTRDAVKKIESFCRSDMTADEVTEAYEQWEGYDQDLSGADFRGPSVTASAISEYYLQGRENVTIFDVAAGSGFVGAHLHRLGFKLIDALDPSQAMLDRAKLKKVYRNFTCAYINEDNLDFPEGSYDAITCCAAIAEGHLPACAMTEMFRLVKPGGVIVIVGNTEVWKNLPEYSVKMVNIIKDLENDGKLQTLKDEIFDNYRVSDSLERSRGILIVMKKV